MIYSRWNPTQGGYDYFKASSNRDIPLANDLPTPNLPVGTRIGVPSVEAGRPIPATARPAGHGQDAVGMIAPTTSSRGLGAVSDYVPSYLLWFAGGMLAVLGIRRFRR